ncbi:hypothetical protein E2C01_058915 [Portunus trituberculatus]|uniref:Uncharacterized protein n=1 Tax=Portunus trituberculatus TaxID=210409 RepID=A0A5B7H7N1_PORTR|nr:hypothetical protein [Portunus trituberculatus]
MKTQRISQDTHRSTRKYEANVHNTWRECVQDNSRLLRNDKATIYSSPFPRIDTPSIRNLKGRQRGGLEDASIGNNIRYNGQETAREDLHVTPTPRIRKKGFSFAFMFTVWFMAAASSLRPKGAM